LSAFYDRSEPDMESEQVPAGSIVVGVDGSPSADLALEWAARQASLEHRPLVLVHAEPPPSTTSVAWLVSMGIDRIHLHDQIRRELKPILTRAADAATAAHPGLDIRQVLRLADPRETLLDLSRDAAAVVVGTHGRGPIRGLLLGSVSHAVSTRAHGPVVVVRQPAAEPRHGVVVGVEGLGHDGPELELAYRVAQARGLPVTAVHCFWDAADVPEGARDVADDEPGLDDQRTILSETTMEIGKRYPDVTTRLMLARGFVDVRLVSASREAALVVIGHRRKPLLNEIVYGSLAPRVLERAYCSVAVVPGVSDAPSALGSSRT